MKRKWMYLICSIMIVSLLFAACSKKKSQEPVAESTAPVATDSTPAETTTPFYAEDSEERDYPEETTTPAAEATVEKETEPAVTEAVPQETIAPSESGDAHQPTGIFGDNETERDI